MKAADRDKLLLEMSGRVEWMYQKLNGNGQPGYLKRLDVVEERQESCQKNIHEDTKTSRFTVTTAVAVISLVIAIVTLLSVLTIG